APVAFQFGKYDVFTVTGTPVRLTWKLMELSVVLVPYKKIFGSGRAGAEAAVAAVTLGQEGRPPAVRATSQRDGVSYQATAGPSIGWPSGPTFPSHVSCLGPTPWRTAGWLANGVTKEEWLTSYTFQVVDRFCPVNTVFHGPVEATRWSVGSASAAC